MKKTVHISESRGLTAVGWLVSRHTFSFGGYHDNSRMNFGLLRVLNDDLVLAGEGFDSHHHDNMEIISIPLDGSIKHKDSIGTEMAIKTGDVQLMSAGSGVEHSEFNASADHSVHFLQIWVFPKKRNIAPRYDQKTFDFKAARGQLLSIVSPEENSKSLMINQDAWFSMGILNEGQEMEYKLKKNGNGIYVFVIRGKIEIGGEILKKGDGMGIRETNLIKMKAVEETKILVIDVPMEQS